MSEQFFLGVVEASKLQEAAAILAPHQSHILILVAQTGLTDPQALGQRLLGCAESGILFSSGMAAISTTVLSLARCGDHVVMFDELYGGTHAFATDMFDRLGIRYCFAATDADSAIRAVTPETKVIAIESPTNPLLGILDISPVAEFAKSRGILTVIDNTFASPVNQNPIRLGIDVVIHNSCASGGLFPV